MPIHKSGEPGNTLLGALSRPAQRRFLADCTRVDLELGQVLATSGERMPHVYFPTNGYIALTVPVDGIGWLGIGLIGDEEGMLGVNLALGIDVSPLNAAVLGEGEALRMQASTFRHQLKAKPGLCQVVNRYCYLWVSQLVQASFCNQFHLVERRLARRLLMTQDRAHADTFHVTQQALALVLGRTSPGGQCGCHGAATSWANPLSPWSHDNC